MNPRNGGEPPGTDDWDPAAYLDFEGPRLRPALDLLAAVHATPRRIVDLGCGPGTVTALLSRRWPEAQVVGVDHSPAMLDQARQRPEDISWFEADLATWRPGAPVDLVFSNAALHWVDDHERLLPRLVSLLAPGGVLAVQMPHNHGAPSHTVAVDLARQPPWRDALRDVVRASPVASLEHYHEILAPHVAAIDLWETIFLHVLVGDDPVVSWTRGSMLRPLLDALDGDLAATFEAAYRERIRKAYPPRNDHTLFPFRRLFLVATAPGQARS